MPTTVELDDNALRVAQEKASQESISIGRAASMLILKGAGQHVNGEAIREAVFRSTGSVYTSADVARALEDDE
jgi:hypothetical protein